MKHHLRMAIVSTVAALLVFAVASFAQSALQGPLYLPVLHGAAVRTTGVIVPPHGLVCLLQQGTTRVIDPRTDLEVYSCEATNGHGQIVFTHDRLLMDHVATGSGSLSVTDGKVYIIAVQEDGTLIVREVPT